MKTIKAKLFAMLIAVTMIFAMAPLTAGFAFADDENVDITEVEMTAPDEVDVDATEPETVDETADETVVKASPGNVSTKVVTMYNVWIKGKQVTSEYKSGTGWKYSEKDGTGTLTLNNANFSGSYENGVIYAKGITLDVELVGINTITNKAEYGSAIRSDKTDVGSGQLGFEGNGSLKVKANEDTIYADGNIYIGRVSIKAESTRSYAIHSRSGYLDTDLSNLTAISGQGDCIHTLTRILFENTVATVQTKAGSAVYVESGSVYVHSSKLTAKSDTYGVQTNVGGIEVRNCGYLYPAYLNASGDISAVYASAIFSIMVYELKVLEPGGGYINGNIGYATIGTDVDGQFKPATHVIISKYANTLSVKGKTPIVKYKKLKKKTRTVSPAKAYKITDPGQGKLTFSKLSGNKKIKVGSNGKITVKKGLKKGKFKVRVKVHATGDADHNFVNKTVTVTIRVK